MVTKTINARPTLRCSSETEAAARPAIAPTMAELLAIKPSITAIATKRIAATRTTPRCQSKAAAGQAIDQALLIEVDREELVRRLAGRWICRACQTPYHERSAPPAKPGVCDACGGELYQRDDDRPEVVGARLETYEKQTGPLAGYYGRQGKLARIDGLGDIEDVAEKLGRAIGGRAAVAAADVKVE